MGKNLFGTSHTNPLICYKKTQFGQKVPHLKIKNILEPLKEYKFSYLSHH